MKTIYKLTIPQWAIALSASLLGILAAHWANIGLDYLVSLSQ